MASRGRDAHRREAEPPASRVIEPITLTDPDGAVTRLAPSSTWTREQVRAPGGEPALVTRLDSGQLWFAAGRRRSPWHHEVHVGAAVVSTPDGRFHAIAEANGGATVVCLAGRARVVTALRDPLLLRPEESAAVSGDGETLVVMDRTAAGSGAQAAPEGAGQEPLRPTSDIASDVAPAGTGPGSRSTAIEPVVAVRRVRRRSHRWESLPEVVVAAAVLALLVALAVVFGRPDGERQQASSSPTATTSVRSVPTTRGRPTTTDRPTTTVRTTTSSRPTTTVRSTTTARPTTTVRSTTTMRPAPTTTAPPRLAAAGALAHGTLVGCRRWPGGVKASVDVVHAGGPTSSFQVTVAVRDAGDAVLAEAQGLTEVLPSGGQTRVDVLVPVAGAVTGACEVMGVVPG